MLQQIVHQLDTELERLQAIRDIVAGLHSAPLQTEIASLDTDPDLYTSAELPSEPTRPKKTQRSPRTAKKASKPEKHEDKEKPAAELRALKSSIPAGPVVVSAQSLARERETRAAGKTSAASKVRSPETDGAALDALTRSLANRWRVGTDSSPHTS